MAVAVIAAVLTTINLGDITANRPQQVILDWDVEMPNEITIKAGKDATVPIKFYGSAEARDVNIIVTGADPKLGAIHEDVENPILPVGFSVDFAAKNVHMEEMPNKSLEERSIGTVPMKILVDSSTKPGQYLLAIHMVDKDGQGSDGQTIDYIYVNVE